MLPLEREGMRTVGMPVLPKDVRIDSHLKKDGSQQVVVKADDGKGAHLDRRLPGTRSTARPQPTMAFQTAQNFLNSHI